MIILGHPKLWLLGTLLAPAHSQLEAATGLLLRRIEEESSDKFDAFDFPDDGNLLHEHLGRRRRFSDLVDTRTEHQPARPTDEASTAPPAGSSNPSDPSGGGEISPGGRGGGGAQDEVAAAAPGGGSEGSIDLGRPAAVDQRDSDTAYRGGLVRGLRHGTGTHCETVDIGGGGAAFRACYEGGWEAGRRSGFGHYRAPAFSFTGRWVGGAPRAEATTPRPFLQFSGPTSSVEAPPRVL